MGACHIVKCLGYMGHHGIVDPTQQEVGGHLEIGKRRGSLTDGFDCLIKLQLFCSCKMSEEAVGWGQGVNRAEWTAERGTHRVVVKGPVLLENSGILQL